MGLPPPDIFANHVARLRGAARRLEEERQAPHGNEAFPVQTFPTDALVLLALGAEIGLKALICHERGLADTKAIRGLIPGHWNRHDLRLLFGLLSPGTQAAIESRTFDLLPQEQTFLAAFRFDEPTEPDLSLSLQGGTSFAAWLDGARLTFEAWRYHYEEPELGPLNVSMLHAFAEAIQEALLGLIARG